MRKRKKYENEFKEMIVGLFNSGIKSNQISKDYDIQPTMITRWVRESAERSGDFSKRKELSKSDQELRALKKALRDITEERDMG